MPPAGWAFEQEEALELLLQAGARRPYSIGNEPLWGVISQAFQARALWSLLESDTPPLLFYQKQTGTLLDVGPACQLTLAWVPDAEGNQHLQADIEPADVVSANAIVVRAGRELCYLDLERGRFGRLSGDPELLRRLRYSPPLPPEMSGWLGERLKKTPALADSLPAPQRGQERTLDGVAPRLKVTMQVGQGQLGHRDGVLVPRRIEVGARSVPPRQCHLWPSSAPAASWPMTWGWARPCRCWRICSTSAPGVRCRARYWW